MRETARSQAVGAEENVGDCSVTASSSAAAAADLRPYCAESHSRCAESDFCCPEFLLCCADVFHAAMATARSRMGRPTPKFFFSPWKPTRPKFMPQQQGENFHFVGHSMTSNPISPPPPRSYGTPAPQATNKGTRRNNTVEIDVDEDENNDASMAAKKRSLRYWTHEEEERLCLVECL